MSTLTLATLTTLCRSLSIWPPTVTTQTLANAMFELYRQYQVGGLLLVVPEHRLSLQLKWHELQMRGGAASLAVCAELQALANMPYLDLLDESDEILHHRLVVTLLAYQYAEAGALPALCWLEP